MTRLSFLILVLVFLVQISCKEDNEALPENPIIKVDLRIMQSDLWKTAYTNVNYIQFSEVADNHNGNTYGMVQNWDGVLLEFDLQQEQTSSILEEPYWESNLQGIRPDFVGSTFVTSDDIFIHEIDFEYIEYIPFREQIEIQNTKEYLVTLWLNLDEVLEPNGQRYTFNASKMSAQIIEL